MNSTCEKLVCGLLLLLMLSAERAWAYYDPGVQRWLNRDPLGELGFQSIRTVGHEGKVVASIRERIVIPVGSDTEAVQSILRSTQPLASNGSLALEPERDKVMTYVFVLNAPIDYYDPYGLDNNASLRCKCQRDKKQCQIRGGVFCGLVCALAAEGPPCLIGCSLAYAMVCEKQYRDCLAGK